MKLDRFGRELVPCETCGTDTAMTGTRRCDACWEVEHRLRDYLRHPKGAARVAMILGKYGYRVAPSPETP